jgi:ubiquinone/menaquinone biosynthesis C-methylase UbiE
MIRGVDDGESPAFGAHVRNPDGSVTGEVQKMTNSRTAIEDYGQRGNQAFEQEMAQRSAIRDAEFLLPHLKPGMRLLDVGCGPGSITMGLAALISPGEVVGIDIQPGQVEKARSEAREANVENARFEVADCYSLPFPDASFDVCYANSVLQHLRDPIAALKEMRRVLAPNGFAALCDAESNNIKYPEEGGFQAASELNARTRRRNGGDPHVGRSHRALLLAAGFARSVASATCIPAGSLEETRRQASYLVTTLRGSSRIALTEGWITEQALEDLLAEVTAWGERPDAYLVRIRCNAIGWVD